MRDLTPADVETTGRTLASAFSDDPVFNWSIGNDGGNEARLTPFFTTLVKHQIGKGDGLACITSDGAAVAVWAGIDDWKMPLSVQIRLTPAIIRAFGRRIFRTFPVLNAIEKQHPTAPHYYLEFLGTRADRQGHGLGSKLLAPMLERCDTEGVPAYLESSNPVNIPFYARHGFEVSGSVDLPAGAPVVTPMWREPR